MQLNVALPLEKCVANGGVIAGLVEEEAADIVHRLSAIGGGVM